MACYLGIDAGGTHCRARIADESGRILGMGQAGPANTRLGLPVTIASIEEAAGQAIAAAGLSDNQVAAMRAGIGLAGLTRIGAAETLRSHAFRFPHIRWAGDAAIACLGAHKGHDGGIVILGTGSNGYARIGGREVCVGGYGFPLSDEGSGARLGLAALQRALQALDGRIGASGLTEAILARFGHRAVTIIDWMDRAGATDFAAFAPTVVEHGRSGDPVATEILTAAALDIDAMIRALIGAGAPRISLMGGLAPHLRPWLDPALEGMIVDPLGDALDGALLLARGADEPPAHCV